MIQRSEFFHDIEANAQSVLQNPDAYKKRQAIVKHPYGTIKRQWGFDHIMTKKTMQHASADIILMFNAYNLTRIWNIIRKTNTPDFKSYLSFITFIESILIAFELAYQLNSKKKILAYN